MSDGEKTGSSKRDTESPENSSRMLSTDPVNKQRSVELERRNKAREIAQNIGLTEKTTTNTGSSGNAANKSKKRDKIDEPRAFSSPAGRSPVVHGERSPTSNTDTTSSLVQRKAQVSKSDGHVFRKDYIDIIFKSPVSSFKKFKLAVKRTTSIRVLKNYLQTRLGGVHNLTLVHNDKDLKFEVGSVSSVGIKSGDTVWLCVKPMAGNSEREEIATLIRMTQSLANLRTLIRSMPASGSGEAGTSGSHEYIQVRDHANREKEHAKMRQKMEMLKEKIRRKRSDSSSIKTDDSQKSSTTSTSMQKERSPTAEKFSQTSVQSSIESTRTISQKELAIYFDPPETTEEKYFLEDEFFDPPKNEAELLKLRKELKTKRCGMCRIPIHPADREMPCLCERVFCSKHRNPQNHRCSIDYKTVDRVHMKKVIPKISSESPRSKK